MGLESGTLLNTVSGKFLAALLETTVSNCFRYQLYANCTGVFRKRSAALLTHPWSMRLTFTPLHIVYWLLDCVDLFGLNQVTQSFSFWHSAQKFLVQLFMCMKEKQLFCKYLHVQLWNLLCTDVHILTLVDHLLTQKEIKCECSGSQST